MSLPFHFGDVHITSTPKFVTVPAAIPTCEFFCILEWRDYLSCTYRVIILSRSFPPNFINLRFRARCVCICAPINRTRYDDHRMRLDTRCEVAGYSSCGVNERLLFAAATWKQPTRIWTFFRLLRSPKLCYFPWLLVGLSLRGSKHATMVRGASAMPVMLQGASCGPLIGLHGLLKAQMAFRIAQTATQETLPLKKMGKHNRLRSLSLQTIVMRCLFKSAPIHSVIMVLYRLTVRGQALGECSIQPNCFWYARLAHTKWLGDIAKITVYSVHWLLGVTLSAWEGCTLYSDTLAKFICLMEVWNAAKQLKPLFTHIDELIARNGARVQAAFSKQQVGPHHFLGSTGYGHGDLGRAALDEVLCSSCL